MSLFLCARQYTATLVDRTAGTAIGDMTANGGLAGAFDGTTNQDSGACAAKGANAGYVGKTWATAKIFNDATLYGSNNGGFTAAGGASRTINIRGKNGTAPSGPTDGTIIGTVTFSDVSNGSGGQAVASTDQSTAWLHWIVEINGLIAELFCAEIVWNELL